MISTRFRFTFPAYNAYVRNARITAQGRWHISSPDVQIAKGDVKGNEPSTGTVKIMDVLRTFVKFEALKEEFNKLTRYRHKTSLCNYSKHFN